MSSPTQPTPAATTRERCASLTGLLLAYQTRAPRGGYPADWQWTAKRIALANGELRALQAYHRDGQPADLARADVLAAQRVEHDSVLTWNAFAAPLDRDPDDPAETSLSYRENPARDDVPAADTPGDLS